VATQKNPRPYPSPKNWREPLEGRLIFKVNPISKRRRDYPKKAQGRTLCQINPSVKFLPLNLGIFMEEME